MLLYIIRHAWAGEAGDPAWPDDTQRPLTDDGRKRFRQVVKQLVDRGVAPSHIASSPLVRCRQTAEILVEHLSEMPTLTIFDGLAPGASAAHVMPWLEHHPHTKQVALVGHAPDVGQLVCEFIGAAGGVVDFSKGAVACVEFPRLAVPGRGMLRWLVTAKMLGV